MEIIKNQFLFKRVCHTDKVVTYLPLSHSAAQMIDVWMTMAAGATVYFADKNALKVIMIKMSIGFKTKKHS